MKVNAQKRTHRNPPSPSLYIQFGIALGHSALRGLEKRGIFCQTSISIEHQHLAKRYVLRGVESGGAVSDMGRYCAYLDTNGHALPWLQPIDSISGGGRHAVVVAPEFVRIEMFRVGRTYELSLSRHSLRTEEGRSKPQIVSTLLFRGQEGTLSLDLWTRENRTLRGAMIPSFYTDAGELRPVPHKFENAVKTVTGALNCLACKHVHVAVARNTEHDLPISS
jgi:hypothetical protein